MSEYIIVNGQLCHADNELYHYGVLGMKWGVRKGRYDEAYSKASKKLTKLENKVNVKRKRAMRASLRADRKLYSPFSTNFRKRTSRRRADRVNRRMNAAMFRAKKWIDAMDKTFKNTPISISDAQVALGKDYGERLLRYADSRSNASRNLWTDGTL